MSVSRPLSTTVVFLSHHFTSPPCFSFLWVQARLPLLSEFCCMLSASSDCSLGGTEGAEGVNWSMILICKAHSHGLHPWQPNVIMWMSGFAQSSACWPESLCSVQSTPGPGRCSSGTPRPAGPSSGACKVITKYVTGRQLKKKHCFLASRHWQALKKNILRNFDQEEGLLSCWGESCWGWQELWAEGTQLSPQQPWCDTGGVCPPARSQAPGVTCLGFLFEKGKETGAARRDLTAAQACHTSLGLSLLWWECHFEVISVTIGDGQAPKYLVYSTVSILLNTVMLCTPCRMFNESPLVPSKPCLDFTCLQARHVCPWVPAGSRRISAPFHLLKSSPLFPNQSTTN